MIVRVDLTHETVTLEEPGNCKRFHVEVHSNGDQNTERVSACLAEAGSVGPDGHAWIEIDHLRKWAEDRVDAAWPESFARMVDYAAQNGWVNDNGSAIRAHIEWM